MIYSTPPADFDGVTVSLQLIEKAVDDLAFANEKPGQRLEYLQEAANLIHDAWLALQTMAGRAQREEEEKKREGGLEACLLCGMWKPLEMMVRETCGYGSEDETKNNHWWHCKSCREAPSEPELDPFEQDEE